MDAYGHCKTIAHCPGTQVILDKAGVEKDDGVVPNADLLTSARCATSLASRRSARWHDLAGASVHLASSPPVSAPGARLPVGRERKSASPRIKSGVMAALLSL
jgi:hypothetical protein